MARFRFSCVDARAEPYAVTPTLAFTIRVAELTGATVHTVALRCQIRIEPHRRRYSPAEAERLADLFGDPARWRQTLKPMQLATVSTVVSGFTGETDATLLVPCTYDLEIASTRYFHALEDGTVGLSLLFSGSAFLARAAGYEVEQLPWTAEARYGLPVGVWRSMVERDFPNSGWLRIGRETLEALGRFKSRNALPTWERAVAELLADRGDA